MSRGTGSNNELRPREHLTEREVEKVIELPRATVNGARDSAMILTGFRHGVSDITKSVFQIHGVDRDSEVAIRKRVSRAKAIGVFRGSAALPDRH